MQSEEKSSPIQKTEYYRLTEEMFGEISGSTKFIIEYSSLLYVLVGFVFGAMYESILLSYFIIAYLGVISITSIITVGFYRYFSSLENWTLWYLITNDFNVMRVFHLSLIAPFAITVVPTLILAYFYHRIFLIPCIIFQTVFTFLIFYSLYKQKISR